MRCIALVFIVSCVQTAKLPAVPLVKNAAPACSLDSDCVLVKSDCCGCNQGGKQMAIHKAIAQNFLDKLTQECGDAVCVQMISKDRSCRERASCDRGACALQPALETPSKK